MKPSLEFTRTALVSLLFVLTVAGYGSPKPNIVVILADDLGCGDMSLYDGWVETPRIDRMAREGMKFTDFHTNSSVCSPTRAALLSGRYQQRYGIVDVIVGSRDKNGLSPSVPTIPRVFKDNGYHTAIFGKWHLGHDDKYNPIHHGFDEFTGFLNGGSDYHVHKNWRVGLEKKNVPGYTTDIITDKSIDFIERKKDKPFFLLVSHAAVHNPYQTPEDKPETREDRKWNQINEGNRERYKVILEGLDESVGKILDTLAELELDENTLVFFLSDNGAVPMNPHKELRPYRGGKFSQYEGGHRVPAVARWPGEIEAGTTSDALIVGMDLFPTFTEIAGISSDNPGNLDGESFKKHLLGREPFPGRDIFFGYEPKLGTAMRREHWKLIVKDGEVELYDLESDLLETTNIAGKHPDLTKDMLDEINEFKATVTEGS